MTNDMKHWTIGLLTALLFGAGGVSAQQPSFRADDPKIDYVGRVAFAEDGSASFDWSGTTVRFRFSGNACAARMSDTKKSYYLVSVDGRPYGETVVWGCDSLVLLADGLQPGPHTLTLFKRTEAGEGLTTLHSIEFPSGGGLLPWFGTSERRIEFIGNSITCGFGSETADPGAEYRAETENAYHSYASIVARFFGADYTLIAHSGQGVVRNYGDTATESDYTMIQRFGKTFDSRETPDWDFSRWCPDVVVIGLGTNDFSVGTPPPLRARRSSPVTGGSSRRCGRPMATFRSYASPRRWPTMTCCTTVSVRRSARRATPGCTLSRFSPRSSTSGAMSGPGTPTIRGIGRSPWR